MNPKNRKIRFKEGQWFAVPLQDKGYAIGLVARGDNKSICLGYFFGPSVEILPGNDIPWKKQPNDAILITQFSHVGIVNGSWPLIQNLRPFHREEWPIPKFGMEIPFSHGKGFIREYDFDSANQWISLSETVVELKEIVGLPKDRFMGDRSVEIYLADLLLQKENQG